MVALAQTLTPEQLVTRSGAAAAAYLGYDFVLSDSQTTNSSYLTVGRRLDTGGFETYMVLRASDHCRPGARRAGWLRLATSGGWLYDMRPGSRVENARKLALFLRRLQVEHPR